MSNEDVYDTLIGFIIGLVIVILNGFTFACLWTWFVVPLGVVSIGLMHAYGLFVLIKFATTNVLAKTEYHNKKLGRIMALTFPIVVLTFGYIAHLFV